MAQQQLHRYENGYVDHNIYFPFGEERKKIKKYVIEQLNGSDIHKNEEILKNFREKAMVRRHYYLTKKLYRYEQADYQNSSSELNQIKYNNSLKSTIQSPLQSNLSSVIQRIYPTYKTPPPIFKKQQYFQFPERNYRSLPKKRSLVEYNIQNPMKNHFKQSINSQIKESIKFRSLDPSNQNNFLCYRDQALKKIKQIAKNKRFYHQNPESNQKSIDQSQILQKISLKQQLSNSQFNTLSKKLKLLKKYKKFMTQQI